jgi:NAD(P)H-hydrate epimerase
MALDLPSGLDADSGAVDPSCPTADITVTLGYPKTGLYAFPGAERVGLLETVDIGVPPGLDDDVRLELMTDDWARAALPARPLSSHKGTFGSTLVVAGSASYVGAAYLAASAAGRSGAGLVTLAIPRSLVPAVAASAAEPTYLPLPEASPGVPASGSADLVLERVGGYQSLLVGCGLGQAPETADMVERLLLSGADLPPTVVDADGLNLLSRYDSPGWWERMPYPAMVTPHPGEMARLARVSTAAIQGDRVGIAVEMARKWDKVVVLKGAFTVVAYPTGEAMLSPLANPGLATAGTGDVLAGAIAGLVAQGLGLERAAALGVYLHGRAADAVRDEMGDTGMIASDLLPALPRAIRTLKQGRGGG